MNYDYTYRRAVIIKDQPVRPALENALRARGIPNPEQIADIVLETLGLDPDDPGVSLASFDAGQNPRKSIGQILGRFA